MIKEIDGIPVKTDMELPDGELLSYVQRGMESFTGEIVSETVRRAKLDASLCTPMEKTVETDEEKVRRHLERMGFKW